MRCFTGSLLLALAGLPMSALAQGPFTQSQTIDVDQLIVPGTTRVDRPLFVTDAGDVFGTTSTNVVAGEFEIPARAVWRANASGADVLSLSGAEFAEPGSGALRNFTKFVNANGQAAGDQSKGQIETPGFFSRSEAWFFDGVNTRAIGLRAAQLGVQPFTEESSVVGLTDDGTTIGRYVATVGPPSDQLPFGATINVAWFSRDGVTTPLGFDTGVFSRPFVNQRSSGVADINNRGQIAGHSDRFNGNAEINGRAAWRYDVATGSYVTMGLTGSAYVSEEQDFFGSSFAAAIADDGTVVGVTELLPGSDASGTGTWMFRNGVTSEIGLRGSLYDTPSGFPTSELRALTDTGIVAGVTNIADTFGQSAWVAIDGVTRRVGPATPDFIGPAGDEISEIADINDRGLVGGSTQTFNQAQGVFGTSRLAWVQDATRVSATPRILALTDPLHGTTQFASRIVDISDTGFVAGESFQFGAVRLPNGGIPASSITPWAFDSTTGDLRAIPLPPTSQGRTSGFVLHLTPRGGVVGLFLTSVASDQTEFYRPFYWSRNAGFVDLAPTGPLYISPWDNDFPIAVSPDGTRVVIGATLLTGDINLLRVNTPELPLCDTIDFNNNGAFPEDQDVIDFFNVLAGGVCSVGNTCGDIDFNNNGAFPEDQDVIDFFNVLAGGEC
jgi:hypothetical protein